MAPRPRSNLQQLLEEITEHVYFQPPENVQLQYPCIIYKRDYVETKFADGNPYTHAKRYMVTVIDRDPDSVIPDQVAELPMSVFNRFYTADNLNHDVYNVFF
jgi:hypothetical protein